MGSDPATTGDPAHHPDRAGEQGAPAEKRSDVANVARQERHVADEQRDVAEEQRAVAEEQREVAEEQRVVAEGQREVAEEQRDTAEELRLEDESLRQAAEKTRNLAEQIRRNAEHGRQAAEDTRNRGAYPVSAPEQGPATPALPGAIEDQKRASDDPGDTATQSPRPRSDKKDAG